jgi:hypothetical protein
MLKVEWVDCWSVAAARGTEPHASSGFGGGSGERVSVGGFCSECFRCSSDEDKTHFGYLVREWVLGMSPSVRCRRHGAIQSTIDSFTIGGNTAEEGRSQSGGVTQNHIVSVKGHPERRRRLRYAIEQEVRYRVSYGEQISEAGTGRTINISLSGVLFTSEHPIMQGAPVTVVMNCAGLLDQTPATELMIHGRVVRSNEKGTVSTIDRYEFRSESSAAKSCRLGTILALSMAPKFSGSTPDASNTASGTITTSPCASQT